MTYETNQQLMKPFVQEEVRTALFQMKPSKAPGPDDTNANFFQRHWHVTGRDVAEYVISIIEGRREMIYINATHITLISKVKNPLSFEELRPVSLCNVIYKIISNMLANRMKLLLPNIISCNQSAFTPKGLISDNTMVVYETFHYMNSVCSGKKG